MLFWIVAGALATLVAALLARPLLGAPDGIAAASDQAVYRDQMQEIGRDLERGLLAPEEAGRARVEVARRLLAADRAGPTPVREAPRGATLAAIGLGAVLLVMGSLLLYTRLGSPLAADEPRAARLAEAEALRGARPSQADAEAAAPATAVEPPADIAPVVAQLREEVPQRPDDLEGWTLLATVEARLGRFAAAARAQERVVAIEGEAATADDLARLADLLVAAADGAVTEATEAVLARLSDADPTHPAVLYYLGLLDAQTGRPDRAFPFWRKLVEEGPEGIHRDMARGQIEQVAAQAGVDWTPPDDGAPAQDPAAQAEMIRGMVEGLAARLDTEGGPAEDWARLVTSRSVLGDAAGAADALARGRAAHNGDAAAQAILDDAAARAGLD